MGDEPKEGAGLEGVLDIWRRRKWLAILVFAGPCAALLSLSVFLPNSYRSIATVLVDRQQVPEAFVRPTVTSALEIRLHTISQEILSRSRLEALIDRFGLYRNLKDRVSPEHIIERMRGDIQLELKGAEQKGLTGPSTIAFAISYRGSNPETVAQVTNTLASFYIEENLKVRERQASGTADFMKVQLEETKKQLDQLERVVSEYKKRYMGELPQQITANLAAVEQLSTQLRVNNDNQTRAAWRREALERELAEVQSSSFSSWRQLGPESARPPDTPAGRLLRLQQELIELRTQFSEKYPEVVRVKAEIAALERHLAERKSDGKPESEPSIPPDPLVLRLKDGVNQAGAEMKALKEEEKRLRSAIATYQARVDNTPRREQEFQELSRDYESTKEHYQSLSKRSEEAQLAEDMEQRQKGEQFRILDPAVAADEPAAPNRIRLALISLVLSLGLAAGAVVLAEQLDTSFHSVDELRASTAVPILVSIPRIVTAGDIRSRRLRMRLASVAAALALTAIVGGSYFIARGNERLVWVLSRGGS